MSALGSLPLGMYGLPLPQGFMDGCQMGATLASGWLPWTGGRCPVSACTRVEVLQQMRYAVGVACAFNWVERFGPTAVYFWRLERPVIR